MDEQGNYFLPDELDNWKDPQDFIRRWEENPDYPLITLYCIGALREKRRYYDADKMLKDFDANLYRFYFDHRVRGVRHWLDKKYTEAIQCFEKSQDSFSHTYIGMLTSNEYPTHDSAKSFEYLMSVVERDGVWFRLRGRSVMFPEIKLHHESDVQFAQFYIGRCYELGYGIRKVKDEKEAMKWYRKSAQEGHSGALKSLVKLFFSKEREATEADCVFKGLKLNKSVTMLDLGGIHFISPFRISTR